MDCCQKVPILVESGLYAGQTIYVPCGKCANCLEHKQNQFLVKSYKAALNLGSFHMVTLTYSPDKVHICGVLASFEDGKVSMHSKPALFDDLRDVYHKKCKKGSYVDSKGQTHYYNLPLWLPVEKQFGCDTRIHLMETFSKKDVQNAIKYFRVYFERKHGNLPPFKYVIVPEYGSLTKRPHFHVCFYGLKTQHLLWFKQLWQRRHGFADVKTVKIVYNGGDGFAKMSSYVSKYVSKGCFEIPEIDKGFVFKPRITSSSHLGLESSFEVDKMRQWYLAFNLAGHKYEVSRPLVNPRFFTDKITGESIKVVQPIQEDVNLISVLVARMSVDIGGFRYPLPKTFKNLFYGQYDKFKKRYTASELSFQIGTYLQARSTQILLQELEKFEAGASGGKDLAKQNQFINDFLFGHFNDADRARSRILKYYQRSKLV